RDPPRRSPLAVCALEGPLRRGDRPPGHGDPRGAGARARAAPSRRRQRGDLPHPRPARRALLPLRHAARPRRLRGAHDLLLPRVPDRGPRPEGPTALAAAAMRLEQVTEASEELVVTIARLLPQLTEARTPPTLAQLEEVVANQTLLVARDEDGRIV